MTILYGVPTMGLPSQTFVTDLMRGFHTRGHSLVTISDRAVETDERVPADEVFTAWTGPERWTTRIVRAVLRRGGGRRLERYDWSRAQARNSSLIDQIAERRDIDVAYIDFGKMAVYMLPGLLRNRIPFVVHFHGFDITRALRTETYRSQLSTLFQHAAALIVASNHIRRLLVLEGAPPEKIRLVRLGVHLDSNISPMPWSVRNQQPPTLAFLGRLVEKKHPVALVESFRLVREQIPNARLIIIGDGPERPHVQSRVQQHGLADSVSLLGSLPRKEALPIINRAWVYAQHSVTSRDGDQEGFGVSMAEAAALGLPVVSTLHNGIPEQVIHEETGLLVLEHDYEAMAAAIVRLFDDPHLREQMGAAGQLNIGRLCDTDQRVDSIAAILDEAHR